MRQFVPTNPGVLLPLVILRVLVLVEERKLQTRRPIRRWELPLLVPYRIALRAIRRPKDLQRPQLDFLEHRERTTEDHALPCTTVPFDTSCEVAQQRVSLAPTSGAAVKQLLQRTTEHRRLRARLRLPGDYTLHVTNPRRSNDTKSCPTSQCKSSPTDRSHTPRKWPRRHCPQGNKGNRPRH